MRASTLFALTAAVLLGLGVAIAAKMSGVFNRPRPEPAKPPEVLVLTATHNLFENFVIQGNDVKLRALRPEEMAYYEQHKDQYLPPVVQAAVMRVAKTNIEADRPILKSDLQTMGLAEPLKDRLVPGTRAVNVAIVKDHAVGGLIQAGDWVDIHLTTQISMGDKAPVTQTGSLARNVRVIAKRNILWSVLQALPDDKPVNFTLEANPYRAALIEFAKDKGTLSLVPVPALDQNKLEARRRELLDPKNRIAAASFSEPDSTEYKDEGTRVEAFLRGDLSVGQSDLVRIFSLRTPAPPALPPAAVQVYRGMEYYSNVRFGPNGEPQVELMKNGRPATVTARGPSVDSSINGFEFHPPGYDPKKCKTCGTAPKK
ncbi:MAG TPA: Flp pilus assembly protein CpaB [Gemmataceae bacterium]|nr:Flp pilus assembly protein CpaB [Gemmataceae bacterium]